LDETVKGYTKSDLTERCRAAPRRIVADVELATLDWVHWHNTSRRHL
jgi:putative transposase